MFCALFSNILTSDKINYAILCDPITLPDIDFRGFVSQEIVTNCNVKIINAEQGYKKSNQLTLPDFNAPVIKGNVDIETYLGVGHVDIIDDFIADEILKLGFWESIPSPKQTFNNWSWKKMMRKSEKRDIRTEYRKHVAKTVEQIVLQEKHNKILTSEEK